MIWSFSVSFHCLWDSLSTFMFVDDRSLIVCEDNIVRISMTSNVLILVSKEKLRCWFSYSPTKDIFYFIGVLKLNFHLALFFIWHTYWLKILHCSLESCLDHLAVPNLIPPSVGNLHWWRMVNQSLKITFKIKMVKLWNL